MSDDLREQIATIEAERAALPEDERLRAEAADAPLLRVQLAHLAEELEAAQAAAQAELRGGLDCAQQAVQWQRRAEHAEATIARVRELINDPELKAVEVLDGIHAVLDQTGSGQ